MPRITVSTPLLRLCDHRTELVGNGTTLGQIVVSAVRDHPNLHQKVVAEDGSIRSQVLVYVDGRILHSARKETPIRPDSEIRLVLIVGGG